MDLYHYRNHPTSVSNGYSSSLLEKFSLLINEMQTQFRDRTPSMESQLYGYAARHSLECIRSVLLYHKGISYGEKRRLVDSFLSDPPIINSFSYTISKITGFKTKLKLYLSMRKWILALYVAYHIRNYLLIKKQKRL